MLKVTTLKLRGVTFITRLVLDGFLFFLSLFCGVREELGRDNEVWSKVNRKSLFITNCIITIDMIIDYRLKKINLTILVDNCL